MRKIIEGKKYDTETAAKLAEWDNRLPVNDLDHCTEALYQTKNGTFFLHGEGGANSPYCSQREGGGRGPGETILPMSEDEARRWAELHIDADDYEEIFGEVEEG